MNRSCYSRRHLLTSGAMGISGLALSWLLAQDAGAEELGKPPTAPATYDLKPKPAHAPPRATAMISLYMQGGPSHIDLFEPKPALDKLDGQKFKGEMQIDSPTHYDGTLMASPWKFSRHGKSRTEVSELLPYTAQVVDDITIIRSMQTGVNNHGQSKMSAKEALDISGESAATQASRLNNSGGRSGHHTGCGWRRA